MVKGSSSRDFLWRRKSISLSNLLTGDSEDELTGVDMRIGSFPFGSEERDLTGVGDEEEI